VTWPWNSQKGDLEVCLLVSGPGCFSLQPELVTEFLNSPFTLNIAKIHPLLLKVNIYLGINLAKAVEIVQDG